MNNNSSRLNNSQALPWENPRFKNWIALVRAEKAVVRALTKALAPLGLKIGQLDILMNLYRHPGISQHDLARRLLIGRSNITMLLPELERMELLSREGDANDKRVMRLTLTPKGEQLLGKALDVYSQLIDRVMSQSSPEQCDMIGEQMRRIEEMLKND
jgi:DNA-binding MarR family transcriptional regulator